MDSLLQSIHRVLVYESRTSAVALHDIYAQTPQLNLIIDIPASMLEVQGIHHSTFLLLIERLHYLIFFVPHTALDFNRRSRARADCVRAETAAEERVSQSFPFRMGWGGSSLLSSSSFLLWIGGRTYGCCGGIVMLFSEFLVVSLGLMDVFWVIVRFFSSSFFVGRDAGLGDGV